MLIDLLRAQYNIWGLVAPKFAWWAAVLLLIMPLSAIGYLWWAVRREFLVLAGVTSSIQSLSSSLSLTAARGLPAVAHEKLAHIFAQTVSLRAGWHGFNSLLVRHPNGGGEHEYLATDSAGTAFSETAVFAGRINRSFYAAIPGIVTGTGLLFTFLAILVALLDIRIDNTNRVQGLSLLIEGLSGKFISSIAAIFGATIFMLAEKPLIHRLTKARLKLVHSLDEMVPRITPATALVELQQKVSEQTKVFRSFNADLALGLKESFSHSVGPKIERMVGAVEGLAELLHKSESQKQQAIKEFLGETLLQMQQSIAKSLEAMGHSFKDALSHTAMEQFAAMSKTVGDTASLLQSMNAQFAMTQSTLNQLNVSKMPQQVDSLAGASESSAEQVALGRTQIDELADILRQFTVQINESAGNSATRISAAFTDVMRDLSANVGDLQRQIKSLVGMANASAEQVALSRTQVDDLTVVLRQFMGQMNESAGTSATRIASAFNNVVRELSTSVSDLQREFEKLVGMAKSSTAEQAALGRTQVDDLAAVLRQFIGQMNESAGKFMAQMNESAGASASRIEVAFATVMGDLSTHVNDLQQQFENLVGIARTSAEQVALGQTQVDDLTGALLHFGVHMNESAGRLVAQLDESAVTSANRIAAAFGDVMYGVSARVSDLQQEFDKLAGIARSSTAEQIALGRTQTDNLTAVLRQFMAQVNESAGISAIKIEAAFAGVMRELSAHVSEMQKQMAASMQEHAEKASAAAGVAASAAAGLIMEQAGAWTARNEEQYEQLVKGHEVQANKVKEMEVALVSALGAVNASLTQYADLNSDFRKIAAEVNAIVATSAAATQNILKTQRSVEQVATQTAHQLEQSNRAQKEVWAWIYNNIKQYQDIFGLTENRARDLLAQMTKNLDTYMDSNRQIYEGLIAEADGQLALATKKLGVSVTDLTTFLQNLTETLKNTQGSRDGRRS